MVIHQGSIEHPAGMVTRTIGTPLGCTTWSPAPRAILVLSIDQRQRTHSMRGHYGS